VIKAFQGALSNLAVLLVIAVVGLKPDGKRRGIAMLQWGLVANWANDPKSGPRVSSKKSLD